jgi:hypothetical protein
LTSFNDTIHKLELLDLPLLDRLFTWSNHRVNPTMARLDRVFLNVPMSLTFPNSTLTSLPKTNSDHTPIQLTLSTSIPKPNFFRFENCWLRDPGFLPAILPAWNDNAQGCVAASLVRSLKMVRSASKTWARGKRTPPSLHSNCKFVIYLFDLLEEGRLLSEGEQLLRAQCREQLALSLRERAAYWKQRGKFRAVREDDSNTRYFHARANQRLRQNQIRVLEVDGVTVASHTDKTAALTAHLKELLREPAPLLPASDLPAMLYSGSMVVDPEMLTAPFTKDEEFAAVKAMNRNSSPGPDGFGPSFYKASSETVAPTVMRFVHAFSLQKTRVCRAPKSLPCVFFGRTAKSLFAVHFL